MNYEVFRPDVRTVRGNVCQKEAMGRGRFCACVYRTPEMEAETAFIPQSGIVLLHLIHPPEINDMYACTFVEQLREPTSETFQLLISIRNIFRCTVEPRFNEPRYNEDPVITNNI